MSFSSPSLVVAMHSISDSLSRFSTTIWTHQDSLPEMQLWMQAGAEDFQFCNRKTKPLVTPFYQAVNMMEYLLITHSNSFHIWLRCDIMTPKFDTARATLNSLSSGQRLVHIRRRQRQKRRRRRRRRRRQKERLIKSLPVEIEPELALNHVI